MCDFILFLGKDGRILEQGSFAELNAKPDGKFAEFVRIQNLVDESPKGAGPVANPIPMARVDSDNLQPSSGVANNWKIVKDSLRQMFMLSSARTDPVLEDTAHSVEKLLTVMKELDIPKELVEGFANACEDVIAYHRTHKLTPPVDTTGNKNELVRVPSASLKRMLSALGGSVNKITPKASDLRKQKNSKLALARAASSPLVSKNRST